MRKDLSFLIENSHKQSPLNHCYFIFITLILFFVHISVVSALEDDELVSGSISTPGEEDSYTFTATIGESVFIQVADLAQGPFVPRISLYDPGGTLIFARESATVAVTNYEATENGTYTIIVSDGSNGADQTGNYDLYFAQMPGANEGGLLTSDTLISNAIDLGDLDSYTFTATIGESVFIQVADLAQGPFVPRISLYDPGGTLIFARESATVAVTNYEATENGTYTIIVSDGSNGADQTGNYDLYFAQMPGANEGGLLTNDTLISNAIDLGDLDSYTFTATIGESVFIQVADLAQGPFVPRISLYDPGGTLIFARESATVAVTNYEATENGTYTIIVSDGSNGADQTGNYDLYFAQMPGANEGGQLINGSVITNTIDLGDLDSYTFTATTGANVQIQVTDLLVVPFVPRISLYDPGGTLIFARESATVAVTNYEATENGTYTIIVSDGSNGADQTGDYRLEFTIDQVVVDPSNTIFNDHFE